MKIALIILACLFGLILLYFILKAVSKPKMKYKGNNIKKAEVKKEEVSQPVIKNVQGLSFDEKFIVQEEPIQSQSYSDALKNLPKDFPLAKKQKPKKKSLAQQISELSPELKALLLDRGLARKDIDINSKKD